MGIKFSFISCRCIKLYKILILLVLNFKLVIGFLELGDES